MQIFVSYRQADVAYAGRICDSLRGAFGAEAVFMAVDRIAVGTNYRERLNHELLSCSVMVAVIGRGFLDTDDSGIRRVDDALDWVRIELETALARKVAVVPVILPGATMPRTHELPSTLRALEAIHAMSISDERWQYDVQRLVAVLRQHVESCSVDGFTECLVLSGHHSGVCSVAFSPDATTLASGGAGGAVFRGDCSVRLWRVSDGAPLHVLDGHKSRVYGLEFGPYGETLVSLSKEGISLWSGVQRTRRLPTDMPGCATARFVAHGEALVLTGANGFRLLRVKDGEPLLRVDWDSENEFPVSVADDRSRIAACGPDNSQVQVFDCASGQLVESMGALHEDVSFILCAEMSANGRYLVTGWSEGQVIAWDVDNGVAVFEYRAPIGELVTAVATTASGELVASATGAGRIRLHTPEQSGPPIELPSASRYEIDKLVFSPDGETLLSFDGGMMRCWDVGSGQQRFACADTDFGDCAFTRDLSLVAVPYEAIVRVWSTADGEELGRLERHTKHVISAAFSPDGRMLATASDDGTVRTWEAH